MNSDTRKYFFWKPLIVLTKMHESNKWAAQLVEQFKPCSLIARLMTAQMKANARDPRFKYLIFKHLMFDIRKCEPKQLLTDLLKLSFIQLGI